MAPFETFLFHTMKVIELALNKNLSDEQIVEEVRKIRGLSNAILADIHKENAGGGFAAPHVAQFRTFLAI